ncbi:MAG: nickel-dependent hydrogenase large subunit [Anaerolineaceae bacterium]|nr:MAG: nickel-dependent hydrogenase large subunit [Anaerolineaceae bacterium]
MKTIEVPALARVEGEGGLYIGVKDGKAVEIRLDIYEPPRFFEGFLVGRYLQEVPDITARICGICPVAYQMSSAYALEKALDVRVSPPVRALRRLLYCAEYIESHALHIYLLQAPDLLGVPSALDLAAVAPEVVKGALRMKKIGNEVLKAIGGRSVHPVNACVGGWYRWPDAAPLKALLPELEWGLEAAKECVKWSLTLPYPDLEIAYEFVALHHPDEYGVIEGEVWSSKGRKLPVAEFETGYIEEHVKHSNALHSHTVDGGHYLTGPLARLNLNHAQLMPAAQKALKDAKLKLPLKNPYKSLIARAIELVHFYEEAIALIKAYAPAGPAHAELTLKAGEGAGATEAPRGLLYHRYKIDEHGRVQFAKITPPTAQNLPRIEEDLFALAPKLMKMEQEAATLTAEHLVRAYDPCISCATHFLKLKIESRE